MKSYKNIWAIAGAVMLGAFAVSCQKDMDFLTEKPKDKLTVNNAYDNSDQVINTLLTGYYEFEELFFPNDWGQGLAYNTSTGTDMTDNKYQLGVGAHMSNFTGAWTTTSSLPKSLWDKFYKVISYANLALSKMDAVEWPSEEQKSRIAAEAHFLRGISYLRLAELFGGVPMVLEYTENPNYGYVRATREETYTAAIEDFKLAYAGLPWNISAEYGRAGKGAAAMYLSEALLGRGVETDSNADYTEAAKYAKEVVANHPLMTQRFGARVPGVSGEKYGVPNEFKEGNVISDLFVAPNIVNPQNTEAIWVMVSAPDYASYAANGGRRNCTLGFTPALPDFSWAKEYANEKSAGPWKTFSKKYGGAANPASHGGTGWAQSTPTWYACYTMWDAEHNNNTTADLRYIEDVTVITEFMCCDENHPLYEQKVGWNHIERSTPELSGIFFPIFYKETPFSQWDYDQTQPAGWFGTFVNFYRSRYAARSAEAYFLFAEALLRSGDVAGATAALNTVRARANANPFATIDIDTILDERGRELLYEEFRWATFLRMKPQEWKKRIYDHGMYSARSSADPATLYPNTRRWAEFTGEIAFDLFPIPQSYIDLNTEAEMTQNKGW